METLAERISQGGPLGPEDAVGWVIRLAKHLESLHVHGVAHGSISPACVASDGGSPSSRGVVLDVRKIAADVSFHSPERVRSGQISPQDDAWALAATLYTLLTATPPFQGASEPETRDRILAGQPAPLAVFGVDDENLQKIVAGGIAREPSHRYANLGQIRSDLERWLPGGAALPALEDEADGDEDQAATTMLPMQEAMRAVAGMRPAAAPPVPPAPPPAAGAPPPLAPQPPGPPRPAPPPAPPTALSPGFAPAGPPRPAPPSAPRPAAPALAPPVAPQPPPADEATGEGLFEEPSFDQAEEPKAEADDTVMRELPAHIMAMAARSAAGSEPPPPGAGAVAPAVPRPPSPPSSSGPMIPSGPPSRPEPARPAAAARPRAASPVQLPGPPPDEDVDDVRTVFAVHPMGDPGEGADRPAPPAPPPPPGAGFPGGLGPMGAHGVPAPSAADDDEEDEGARTVIRDPGAAAALPGRAPLPAPPPPQGMGRQFKSTQLGVGGGFSAPAAPGGWSPAAAPVARVADASPHQATGAPDPLRSPQGPGGAAPAFAESPSPQITPQSGIRLGGGPEAPAPPGPLADMSALIQDALGPMPPPEGPHPSPSGGALAAPNAFGQPFSPQQGFAPPGFPPGPDPAAPGALGAFPGAGGPGAYAGGGPGGYAGMPGAMQQGAPLGGGFPGAPGFSPGVGFDPAAPPPAPHAPTSAAGPAIPPHLLATPGQAQPARSSMRTWYLVCGLAMILVAAVTFIALRYMSAG